MSNRPAIHRHEWFAVGVAFLYFFCVLAAYYVIRPVRDQLSAAVGSTSLPIFYAATFIATRSDRRFCSDRCRLRHWRQARSRVSDTSNQVSSNQADLLLVLGGLRQEVAELRTRVEAMQQTIDQRTC